jgi:hypothetical protein
MQPSGGQSVGDWLADFYAYLMGNQTNISSINVNQSALDAGYTPADLAGVDASAAYAEACGRPGIPAEYKTAPPPPPHSSPEYVVRHIQTTQVTNIEQNFTNIDNSRDVNNILDIDGDVSGGLDFSPVTNTGDQGQAAGDDAQQANVDIDSSGGDATSTGGTATGTGGTATGGEANSANDASGGAGTGGAGGDGGGSSADGGPGGAGGPGGNFGPLFEARPLAADGPEAARVISETPPRFDFGLGGGDGGDGGDGGTGGTSTGGAGGAGGAGTGGDGGDIDSETEANADASGNADASADSDGGDGGPVSLNINFGSQEETEDEDEDVPA